MVFSNPTRDALFDGSCLRVHCKLALSCLAPQTCSEGLDVMKEDGAASAQVGRLGR